MVMEKDGSSDATHTKSRGMKMSYVKYMPRNTIQTPYNRCRLYGAQSNIVDGEATSFYIDYDGYHGHRDWDRRLTWETWCQVLGHEDDPQDAMRELRRLCPMGYRLDQNPKGLNHIVVHGLDAAKALVAMWTTTLGERNV